jgi:hypothetical protein
VSERDAMAMAEAMGCSALDVLGLDIDEYFHWRGVVADIQAERDACKT